MPLKSSDPFIRELMAALGLPKRTIRFTLSAAVEEVVTVSCEYFPDEDFGRRITERFKLERIDDGAVTTLNDSARALAATQDP